MHLVVLSGPVGAGRSTLAEQLVRRHGARSVNSCQLLNDSLGARPRLLVLEDIHTRPGLDALRERFHERLLHVHLRPPGDEHREPDSPLSALEREADLVLDTGRLSPEDLSLQVAGALGLFGRNVERLVDVLVGGQYGGEGKGRIAAHLAPEYGVLVRAGGPHGLPSDTRASARAKLVLGPGSVLSLPVLLREIQERGLAGDGRLFIDPRAVLIEPQDVFLELDRLKGTLGSSARGEEAARARKVLRAAARPEVQLAGSVEALRPFLRPTHEVLDEAFARGERVLLEGTGGTGLSLHHGDYPHVSSRDTTASGCLAEAGIPPGRVRKTVLVCRTHPVRAPHPEAPGGSSGPLARELTWEEISRRSGIPEAELLQAERAAPDSGPRRVGEFDWALLRRAVSLNAPTDVALTFVDQLSLDNRRARRFEQLTPDTRRRIEELERVAGAPVSLVSTRSHPQGVLDRRQW